MFLFNWSFQFGTAWTFFLLKSIWLLAVEEDEEDDGSDTADEGGEGVDLELDFNDGAENIDFSSDDAGGKINYNLSFFHNL